MTPRHAKNSVAAKMRKRIADAASEIPDDPKRYIPHPRPKCKWRIQVRDEKNGDSFTIRLYETPWKGMWAYSEPNISGLDGLFKKLRVMLNNAA